MALLPIPNLYHHFSVIWKILAHWVTQYLKITISIPISSEKFFSTETVQLMVGQYKFLQMPIFTQKLEFYHQPQILVTCLPWSDRHTVLFGEAACQNPKSEWLEIVSRFQVKMIYEKSGELGLPSWSCPRLSSKSQCDSINNMRAFSVLPVLSRRISMMHTGIKA